MRVFYVFKIKDSFYDMYKDNPYKLYRLLQEIRCIQDYDIKDTKKKLLQIINIYNKNVINEQIKDDLYSYSEYFNKDNVHIICDNYEYTKLIVENYVLKVKSNQKYPTILKSIKEDNVFVCDFVNHSYFFLNLEKSIA